MRFHITILAFLLLLAELLSAQYIAEVYEYVPAPGQLINEAPWGNPSSPNSIIGGVNGSLSLGAFGGYVVFSFDQPIQNHPDHPYGVDFTIFGNPNPTWSEAGVVWVMKDENENGQPDDTWYQLAGSDYWFSSTVHDYQVTYTNPGGDEALDVPWTDNFGNSGVIMANAYHMQPYYPLHDSFPGITSEQYLLEGTCLNGSVDTSNPGIVKSYLRAFGYTDNHSRGAAPYTLPDNPYTEEIENAGGDAFNLSWAVDENGNYVELDKAHFIKLQTGILANGGWIGEVSTEITGACVAEPNAGISGEQRMVVIKDLPPVVRESPFQLEVFAFLSGRVQPDMAITWECNQSWASVDDSHMLTVSQNGEVEITAKLTNHPEISVSVMANIELSSAIEDHESMASHIRIYPNPATDRFLVSGLKHAEVEIYTASGQLVKILQHYDGQWIETENLPEGLFLLKYRTKIKSGTAKLILK